MKTLKITQNDLGENGIYVGAEDVTVWEGHIEIEGGLGWVRFKECIRATGRILAGAGAGIEAGLGIKAGLGIEAGLGIKAGAGIEAGLGIKAGAGIEAGLGIKAGLGIEAGKGIKAGLGIKAGEGIKAKTVSARLRIFAGLCMWRLPQAQEMEIRAKVLSGKVCYGTVVAPQRTVDEIKSDIRSMGPEVRRLLDELEAAQ